MAGCPAPEINATLSALTQRYSRGYYRNGPLCPPPWGHCIWASILLMPLDVYAAEKLQYSLLQNKSPEFKYNRRGAESIQQTTVHQKHNGSTQNHRAHVDSRCRICFTGNFLAFKDNKGNLFFWFSAMPGPFIASSAFVRRQRLVSTLIKLESSSCRSFQKFLTNSADPPPKFVVVHRPSNVKCTAAGPSVFSLSSFSHLLEGGCRRLRCIQMCCTIDKDLIVFFLFHL